MLDPYAPTCPYCQQPAQLRDYSAHLYHGRDYGPVWECVPCQAWVGCHKGSVLPLGTPANAATRKLRVRAHAEFDPIWRAKAERETAPKARGRARAAGYAWLSEQLGIPSAKCHIGMMSDADLQRVIDLCAPYAERLSTSSGSYPESE